MEMEYKDPSRRGRYIVIIGVDPRHRRGRRGVLSHQPGPAAGRPGWPPAGLGRRRHEDDPGAQAHRGGRRRRPGGPARPDQRPGHRLDAGQGHRPRAGGDDPRRPARDDQPPRLERRGRAVLGPRPRRDRRAEQRAVARRVADRPRRARGRRPPATEPDGRRLRHRERQRAHQLLDGRRQERLLHRQVDEDRVPGHGWSSPRPRRCMSSRHRRPGRGDLHLRRAGPRRSASPFAPTSIRARSTPRSSARPRTGSSSGTACRPGPLPALRRTPANGEGNADRHPGTDPRTAPSAAPSGSASPAP